MAEQLVTFDVRPDATIATLNFSEITHEVSEALQREVTGAIAEKQGVSLILDLTRVTFLGSVGLTTLVILLKRLKEAGGRLIIAGLSGQRLRVMELTRMTRIFDLQPDLSHAMAALKAPESR